MRRRSKSWIGLLAALAVVAAPAVAKAGESGCTEDPAAGTITCPALFLDNLADSEIQAWAEVEKLEARLAEARRPLPPAEGGADPRLTLALGGAGGAAVATGAALLLAGYDARASLGCIGAGLAAAGLGVVLTW